MRGEGGRERPRSHPQIIPAFRVRVSKAPMKRQTDYSDSSAGWPGSPLCGGFRGAFWNLQRLSGRGKRLGAFVPGYPAPW